MKICECLWNCGLVVASGKKFISGHYNRGRSSPNKNRPSPFKGKKHTEEANEKNRQAHLGKQLGNKHSLGIKKSQETIKKQKETLAITNQTEETKQRRSLASKQINSDPQIREASKQRAIKQIKDPTSKFGKWPGRDSYPEKYFKNFLESLGAIENEDFFREYQVGKYRIDFAYIDEQGKRAIEIDGGQHLLQEAIEHDRIRDEYLIEQGWQVFRIPVKNLYRFLEPMLV